MRQHLISLSVPFPPTTNNLFMNVGKRRIPTKAYRDWRELACVVIDEQVSRWGYAPIDGPYHMVIELDRPDKRGRDVSNYAKAVEDALVLSRVIRDDSDALSLMLKWSDRAPGKNAHAHVEIEAA
jgi:Holliday junction resolvase RusA-like endonuclease